jgi:pimeloyl-ACP methyl ester carboxylesterase
MRQAQLIHQALVKIGAGKATIVGHSWSGALATAYALSFPDAVSGLVLLAGVTHPWPGGVAWLNHLVAAPVIGPLVAYTVILPLGYFLIDAGVTAVFAPQAPPPDYDTRTGVRMILRPQEFIANVQDIVDLHAAVTAQSPRYGEIKAPTAIVAGDADRIVYTDIHSRGIYKMLPDATLAVLPGVGHMVHFAATDTVLKAIDLVVAKAKR